MQRIPEGKAPASDAAPAGDAETRLRGLLLAGMDGDQAAYRDFLQATAAHLRAYLRRRLNRWPDEIEDLVQESLLAIHNQRMSYDRSAPLTAWMHAIAKYKLIDWLRRHARQEALHDPLDDEDVLFASSDTESSEARRDLDKMLQLLPQQQRAAILHTKVDGLSVREAAAAMNISESLVKVAVHRGLKALAAKLRNPS